jgi:predicted transcriptional regulator
MAIMVRKQVYLRPEQNRQLKRLAGAERRTEAELIREAVDDYIAKQDRIASWEEHKKEIDKWLKTAPRVPGRKFNREEIYDRKIFSRY